MMDDLFEQYAAEKLASEGKKRVITVSELTGKIKRVLEETCGYISVEGEISNLKLHSSGHVYFVLKDSHAQIRVVFFKSYASKVKFALEDGLVVVASGEISVYETRGEYQLYVKSLEPKGIGSLMLAYEQLKEKLYKEGLFDEDRKKNIPLFPRSIAVITSLTGAALRDMMRVISRRFAELHLVVFPVHVQGSEAAPEIVAALKSANKMGETDVIILGRGGGSIEDLWAFNEEIVARAIYDSEIPIISAVGHEIDWTIADYVADLRAATPSAAAERVSSKKSELVGALEYYTERLHALLTGRVTQLRRRCETAATILQYQNPLKKVHDYQQLIDDYHMRMAREMQARIKLCKQSLLGFAEKMEVLNPLKVLQRGFSMTTESETGSVILDASELKSGDTVRTRLHKGGFLSIVEKIEKED